MISHATVSNKFNRYTIIAPSSRNILIYIRVVMELKICCIRMFIVSKFDWHGTSKRQCCEEHYFNQSVQKCSISRRPRHAAAFWQSSRIALVCLQRWNKSYHGSDIRETQGNIMYAKPFIYISELDQNYYSSISCSKAPLLHGTYSTSGVHCITPLCVIMCTSAYAFKSKRCDVACYIKKA